MLPSSQMKRFGRALFFGAIALVMGLRVLGTLSILCVIWIRRHWVNEPFSMVYFEFFTGVILPIVIAISVGVYMFMRERNSN